MARRGAPNPSGLVLFDKPAGPSSFAIVRDLREKTGARAGHAGTLDPFATGLLVLLAGRGTRLLQFVPSEPKVYEATIAFGTNPVTPPGSSSLTLGTGAVDAGNYNFNVTGSSTTPLQTINVGLNVATASPGAATLLTPANAALNVPALPVFTWGAVSGANTYTIQVATDAGFTNVVASATAFVEAIGRMKAIAT